MIFDKMTNYKIYPYGKAWETAFNFLTTLNTDTEEKRHELGDGIFANVMSTPTKKHEETLLESHRQYVDIQMTIAGGEILEIFPSDSLKVSSEYDSQKDVTFYHYPENPALQLKNLPGFFTVLWPNDAHMTLLKTDNISQVKKAIVKIPVEVL